MLNPTLKCNADRNLAIVHKSLLRFSKGDPKVIIEKSRGEGFLIENVS